MLCIDQNIQYKICLRVCKGYGGQETVPHLVKKGVSLKIVYEDGDVLVVYKEAGFPVQTGVTSRLDLVSLLKRHLSEEGSGGNPYLGLIHRLDQPVEGILVFAKNPKAAAALSAQVSAKSSGKGTEMRKVYQAVVLLPDENSVKKAKEAKTRVVTLRDELVRNYEDNSSRVVHAPEKESRLAELTYRTLKIWRSAEGVQKALLEIHLRTGRHHQIRVQLSHAGLPIEGDRKYGNEENLPATRPLCLCATLLQFRHPVTGKKMKFEVTPSFLEEESLKEAKDDGDHGDTRK